LGNTSPPDIGPEIDFDIDAASCVFCGKTAFLMPDIPICADCNANPTPERLPVFTSLREFITEAINGNHTTEEVFSILDDIERGANLSDADRKIAEEFVRNENAESFVDDSRFLAGVEAGTRNAVEIVGPVLQLVADGIRTARKGQCPVCRHSLGKLEIQQHTAECQLWGLFIQLTDHAPIPVEMPAIPEAESATLEVKNGQAIYRITTKKPANDNAEVTPTESRAN
jgi:hypothetical protein